MSDNTMMAILAVSSMTMGTIIMVTQETEHEKKMHLIEEQTAISELKDRVNTAETIKWCDSMRVVINKEIDDLNKSNGKK
jgi:glycerol-3-phosphate cytidylyltransferase-like family protein